MLLTVYVLKLIKYSDTFDDEKVVKSSKFTHIIFYDMCFISHNSKVFGLAINIFLPDRGYGTLLISKTSY